MNSEIEAVNYGGVAPAFIAAILALLLRAFLPRGVGERWAVPTAVGVAFCGGYALLATLGNSSSIDLLPSRHWHWLPYVAIGAVLLGSVSAAEGVSLVERWLVYFLWAAVSAWLFVPTWASLEPPRSTWVPLLAGYLLMMNALLDPLARRIPAPRFMAMLAISALAVAIMTAAFLSVTYAQVAGIGAAALFGGCVAMCLRRSTASSGGIASLYSILAGGSAFVSAIEPDPAALGMLLVPAAPLALWFTVGGPLSRLDGWKAWAAQTTVVVVVLAIAVIAVAVGSISGGDADAYY